MSAQAVDDGATAPLLLEVTGVCKSFPGVRALDEVSLNLRAGEVLAVVGENGAGKSTLMKILAGVHRPDAGQVRLGGARFEPRSAADAISAGVALIHQELNLAGNLDIAANICLGREPARLGWMNRKAMQCIAREVLASVGLREPVTRRVDELAIGHRQLVEIAKALSTDARIIIMDEPTSSLSLAETHTLFGVVRRLTQSGVGIIYISHRLAEVEEIADRAVVLRDGRVSGELGREAISRPELIQLMVGREVAHRDHRADRDRTRDRLTVVGLRTNRHPQAELNLRVQAGEIVGIAGLVGSGRTDVLEAIFGITPPLAGLVRIDGAVVKINHPRDAVDAGLALVPEDRQLHGLILEASIRRNIALAGLARHAWPGGFVDRQQERTISRTIGERLSIGAAGDRQPAGILSGGNQQKVVLGKWLALEPRVLLMDEPTRGVDVGARAEIYDIMEQLADRGTAILFVSSDLEEVIAMSDRVLVMHDGHIRGELTRAQLTEESIMRFATGGDAAA